MSKSIYAAAALGALLVACSGGSTNPAPQPLTPGTPTTDVYIAGLQVPKGNGTIAVATYWLNGQAVKLGDGQNNSQATAIFADASHVYAAGTREANAANCAVQWVDGKITQLSSTGSLASAITAANGHVYVAGHEGNQAMLWVDGIGRTLSAGTKGRATSVLVSGSDVYVGGYVERTPGYAVATLWKNQVAQDLSDGTTRAEINALALLNGQVIAGGMNTSSANTGKPFLWASGLKSLPANESMSGVSSLAVSGSDVYAVGVDGPRACLWKNDSLSYLSPVDPANTVIAYGIAVAGNDVYATGMRWSPGETTAMVWKNQTASPLSDATVDAAGRGIFVRIH